MTTQTLTTHDSSIWINNLVDGLAGLTIKAKHAIYCDASPFQKIEIFDTYSFGRMLLLGGTIVLTERDEHVYNEMITHPALVGHPAPAKVCIIGGGDGGALREVLKHQSVVEAVVVEIDSMVTDAVKQYLPSVSAGFDDPRTTVEFADGCAWLEAAPEHAFDAIIVDSYDPGGPVQSLETENFFELLASRLTGEGVAVVQTGSPELFAERIRLTVRELSGLFPSVRPYTCTMPSFPLGLCSFVLCAKREKAAATVDPERMIALGQSCRYFGEDVLRGAFQLPAEVKQAFAV